MSDYEEVRAQVIEDIRRLNRLRASLIDRMKAKDERIVRLEAMVEQMWDAFEGVREIIEGVVNDGAADIQEGNLADVTPEMERASHALQLYADSRPSGKPEDPRPANCRFRLMAEGKPYPRSGCTGCGTSIFRGACPARRTGHPV
jgi:hypothetical protein